MKKVGIDIDEVLFPWADNFLLYYNHKKGTNYKRIDFKTYRLWDTIGGTKEQSVIEVLGFWESPFANGVPPIECSVEGIRELTGLATLVGVTSRQHVLKERTVEWIEQHFGTSFSEIHFGNDYSLEGKTEKKVDICIREGIKLLIEDHPDYATECAAAGVRVLLFDAPWNQAEKLPENIERVYSWNEIVKKV